VIKSFGILPDPRGTLLATQERQKVYNKLIRGRVDQIAKSYRPIKGERVDRDAMYRALGLESNAPAMEQGAKIDIKSASADDILKAAGGK
jgi:hypothetical protein